MKNELRHGKLYFISFIIVDLVCLVVSNMVALKLYIGTNFIGYGYKEYRTVIFFMVLVDLAVTCIFNTLAGVLRRRKRLELLQSARHIGLSFVILGALLFSLRRGALYSRVTVYMAYAIDFFLMSGAHYIWRQILRLVKKPRQGERALLMTTDRFAKEGVNELKAAGKDLQYLYLLMNINIDNLYGIPVIKDIDEVTSIICWEWINKVYIYGVDQQMIPEKLINSCKEMHMKIDFVDFNYKVIDVKTIQNADPKYGALSFLEGKRDIPFPIRRVYWITETEADLHRGFHAHKLNCQLLFCPYGAIDIILDDGKEKHTVRLDEPGKGLLLMPGLWREMVWQKSGSVLCVLASEYYDASEYIRNYDEFIAYDRKYNSDVLEIKHGTDGAEEIGYI